MVKFDVGINRYTFKEDSEAIIKKLVFDLNNLFGNKNCPYHPSELWNIDVDLLTDGQLQFSSTKQDGCNYAETLIKEDIIPYLETVQIFPLPSH